MKPSKLIPSVLVMLTAMPLLSGCIMSVDPGHAALKTKLSDAGIETESLSMRQHSVSIGLKDFEPETVAKVMQVLAVHEDKPDTSYAVFSGEVDSVVEGLTERKASAMFYGAEQDDVNNVNKYANALKASGDFIHYSYLSETSPNHKEGLISISMDDNVTPEDVIQIRNSHLGYEDDDYHPLLSTRDGTFSIGRSNYADSDTEFIEKSFLFRDKLKELGVNENSRISLDITSKMISVDQAQKSSFTLEAFDAKVQEALPLSGFPEGWRAFSQKAVGKMKG